MIVDGFTFYNELDMLELRLNELKDTVDLFVLVEMTKTFTGHDKPLTFAAARERFRKWPIRHVVVTDVPVADAWTREGWQRNAIVRGMEGVPDEAVVLISDVDEIPYHGAIPTELTDKSLAVFEQQFFYYTFNNRVKGKWKGTRAATASSVRAWTPQVIRNRGNTFVPNGGWHFSYMGGPDKISEKLQGFSHQEYNTPEFNNKEHILSVMHNGTDLFKRDQLMKMEVVPGDSHLPQYVRDNHDRFAAYFL
jgi:hypothetical protein